jgi:2-haloacid dehalogenase
VLVTRCIAAALVGAVAIAARQSSHPLVERPARARYRAVAFDYLVLFNPDSVLPASELAAPGKGRELTSVWRTRQFEYSWLRSITGRYADFSTITGEALSFAVNAVHVELTTPQRQALLNAYLRLDPWPDTVRALQRLRSSGVRVIALANFSPPMLRANAERAGLTSLFDALVSTDANRTYKPDPRAYQLGVDRLDLPKQDIVFAAFGGWDAAGAKSFGYPTVWVNRLNQPVEELGLRPDRTVSNLNGLVDFVLNASR